MDEVIKLTRWEIHRHRSTTRHGHEKAELIAFDEAGNEYYFSDSDGDPLDIAYTLAANAIESTAGLERASGLESTRLHEQPVKGRVPS